MRKSVPYGALKGTAGGLSAAGSGELAREQPDHKGPSLGPAVGGAVPAGAPKRAVAEDDWVALGGAAAPADAKASGTDQKMPGVIPGAMIEAKRMMQIPRGLVARARGKGLKPIKVTVPVNLTFTVATTGVCSAGNPVAPDGNGTEWNAFVALYDEYRVTGGNVKFAILAGSPEPGAMSAGANHMFALGWDPTDTTAPANGTREVCELAQHILLAPSSFGWDTTVTWTDMVSGFRSANSKPFSFRWTVKGSRSLNVSSAGVVEASPGAWMSCLSGSDLPCGYLKLYCQFGAPASATVGVVGVHFLDIEFRCRK